MKRKIIGLILLIVVFGLALFGCGEGGNPPDGSTPNTGQSPAPTKNSDIIATKAPAIATATPEPTPDPDEGLTFVDVVANNENVFFETLTHIDGYGAEKAFDNDPDTYWGTTIKIPFEPDALLVQFGYPVILDGLSILENVDWGTIIEWEVQYYDEETQEWITVLEEITIEEDEYYEFEQNTKATYAIKILVHTVTGATANFKEITLEGLFVEVPEGTEVRQPALSLFDKNKIPENSTKLTGDWTYSATTNYSDDYAAQHAFDGDMTTRWSSEVGPNLSGQDITVTFGEATSVSGLIIQEEKTWGYVTSYVIEAEVNGQWIVCHEGEDIVNGSYISLNETVNATALRMVIDASTGSSATFWEIEIYS